MSRYLLTPPVSFVLILAASWFFSYVLSFISFKNKKRTEGGGKAYACGEDAYDNMARPDYGQFFVFAFFFTLAHVATLIITTMPNDLLDAFFLAILYLVVVLVSILILFREQHEDI